MQSRKNCAIQGVRLIWKQKIWLAICDFLWSLTNQNACFVTSFSTELTLFCTVWKKSPWSHARYSSDIQRDETHLPCCSGLSEITWRPIWYRLWILERLWEPTRPISVPDYCWDVCCWWSDSWRSLWLRSDWTSAFRSAITFLTCRSLLSMFLIASPFVLTRLASSSIIYQQQGWPALP